jgi:hypothetical protein
MTRRRTDDQRGEAKHRHQQEPCVPSHHPLAPVVRGEAWDAGTVPSNRWAPGSRWKGFNTKLAKNAKDTKKEMYGAPREAPFSSSS